MTVIKEFIKNIKFAWRYTKDQKWKLIKYIISNIILIAISIIVPILSARVIINLTSNNLYQLILISIVIYVVENLRNIAHYFASYYSQVIYRESFINIQTDLGKEILKLENKIIDSNSSGVFIQRMTNDTSRLADIFNILNMYMGNILTDLGIFGAIFVINKIVFIYMLVMIIILYLIEKARVKNFVERDKEFRKKNEKVSGFVGEIVRGARDIKMLNAENSFITHLHQKVVELNHDRYEMARTNRLFRLLNGFTRDSIDIVLMILLVILIKNGSLAVASALVIYNYSGRVPSIVNYIGMLLDNVKDFNLSASRVFSILNSEEFSKEKFGNKHLDNINGNFAFKKVKFAYEKENVLNGIDFNIKANTTTAFVGKSGAGKSTIFSLLCKMYEPTSGTITIDNIDIKELDKETIRGNITVISQNPYIFNLSIRDNLKLVKEDLNDEEMFRACKAACLDEFINSLPDKYETIIGEGGVNLSGGQKQRLAIARALVQKTEIILFDEATSALDNETQANIQQAIQNMKGEYTILIIAHRLSTIVNSDRIIFINDGKIEAEGTHKELLKLSKNYKKLYESEIINNK